MAARLFLAPGRERSVLRGHPWLFSRAIARVEGEPRPGEVVAVHAADGRFLAWGDFSPASQIRVRLHSRHSTPPDAAFWEARLRRAIGARAALPTEGRTDALRLVNAESDGLPGLIVDRYGEIIVLQFLTAGMEGRRALIAELLLALLEPTTLYERSDVEVRRRERLPLRKGVLHGAEPPARVEVWENGLRFLVDVVSGHKTGFYLDQRENRALLRRWMRARRASGGGGKLLNVFAYTGGFSLYGLEGGATEVVEVDSSAEALALGAEIRQLNGWSEAPVEARQADAFEALRQLRREGRRFDLIVLDPPKFAFTRRDVQRAARGYKDINLQALHLLEPGGLLFTFSCSGAIEADLFRKIVFGAAVDAGREVQVVAQLRQGADHPVAITFPEGEYLKGLLCRAVG